LLGCAASIFLSLSSGRTED